jgi:hypothetical protein
MYTKSGGERALGRRPDDQGALRAGTEALGIRSNQGPTRRRRAVRRSEESLGTGSDGRSWGRAFNRASD